MNRIERIIELEKRAERPAALDSKCKWEAARLYWEEIEAGQSKAYLAEQTGKSAMHILFMYRCWDVCIVRPAIKFGSYEELPSFYQTYNSEEVRRPQDRERREDRSAPTDSRTPRGEGKRDHTPREDDGPDYTGHGLIATIVKSVAILRSNRAYWQVLSEADVTQLEGSIVEVEEMLRRYRQVGKSRRTDS